MYQHRTPRALQRAQWFSDLNTALAETEKLLKLLEIDGGFSIKMERLRLRIEKVRSELELLNRVILSESRFVSNAWPEKMHVHAGKC